MNREQVIRMAREAGIEFHERKNQLRIGTDILFGDDSTEKLERFAALVAAEERRKHQSDIETWKAEAATAEKWRSLAFANDPMQPGKAVQEIQREAMELERDACAQLVSDTKEWRGKNWFSTLCPKTKEAIAASIRSRGAQPKD